jgi:hypothetical protein
MAQSKREQRQSECRRMAFELAQSGRHLDYLTIENELVKAGFPEARDWLDRDGLRQDLKRICDQSRNGRTDA